MSSYALSFFRFWADLWVLLSSGLSYFFKGELERKETIKQMYVIGVQSLPIALLTVAFSGMVSALYTATASVELGLSYYIGAGVAIAMAREVAPVLSGVVVAARAGSAMAAEIGSMKVTEQIDALRAIGVSPIQYLVLPRVIASSFVLVIMTIYANLIGDLGGYIVAINYGVPSSSYISSILHYLTPYDFFMGLIKAFFFGLIIALVGCREGLRTEGGAEGVGRATTSSVVLSIILIFASDFVLAMIMFPPK